MPFVNGFKKTSLRSGVDFYALGFTVDPECKDVGSFLRLAHCPGSPRSLLLLSLLVRSRQITSAPGAGSSSNSPLLCQKPPTLGISSMNPSRSLGYPGPRKYAPRLETRGTLRSSPMDRSTQIPPVSRAAPSFFR